MEGEGAVATGEWLKALNFTMPDDGGHSISLSDVQLFKDFMGSWTSQNGSFNVTESMFSMRHSVFRQALQYVDIYCVPLIALVGLCGNLVSFVVFVGTYMRRLSSSIYLAALSLADISFLICVLASWATHIDVHVYNKQGWCQMFIYLTYVSSFLSVWYVVAFTVERYIAVCFPLRRQNLCTTRRARYVVISLGCSSCVLYSFGIWTSGLVNVPLMDPVCAPLAQHSDLVNILHNIDTVITLILPFVCILVMNIRIAFRVVVFYKQRKSIALDQCSFLSLASGEQVVSIRRIPASPQARMLHTRTQVRVTKMLLIVSTIFLALNLPRHVARTYSFVMLLRDKEYPASGNFIVWEKLFQVLYYLHFSVNLFLYSALGKNFRKATGWLGRRWRHSVRQKLDKYFLYCPLAMRLKPESYLSTTREVIFLDQGITAVRRIHV